MRGMPARPRCTLPLASREKKTGLVSRLSQLRDLRPGSLARMGSWHDSAVLLFHCFTVRMRHVVIPSCAPLISIRKALCSVPNPKANVVGPCSHGTFFPPCAVLLAFDLIQTTKHAPNP